ncbi:Afadin and alpha-actinin-binding-domain-containing protein [Xylariaceae sp. FL1272]|nr:Afadin and alpha-actinin-binding-domain-containing protein [Xylariaceae sp. FL1272]
MIDSDNLRTASLYINNQLLSRGLLRDGQNINFANPEACDGGLEASMGQIISVVNDLILRRDRDAEHRESLSSTLRTLRADAQRQATDHERQTDKLNDAQRRLDTADSTERALRLQVKTAEQGIHKLKDEVAKMKSLVAQARSACANEVRKRDRQIDSLKKAVSDAGRVRGGGKSRDVLTINVTGDFNGLESEGRGMPAGATESEEYSLRMETNEFLTELAKGLSEENEGLLALVQRTVDGLREMSGLDRAENGNGAAQQDDEFVTRSEQRNAEELSAELEAIVEHLRSILTNPSFVPIEEVEVRDHAITRLRAGLETMEARWKDAVHMIDGWRQRMVSGGKSVDMEDLQMGLSLSPVRVKDVVETEKVVPVRLSCVHEEEEEEEEGEEEEDGEILVVTSRAQEEAQQPERLRSPSPDESLHLVPAPGYEAEDVDDNSDSDSSIFQDDLENEDFDAEEPNVEILQISTADSINSSPLPEPPQISPLKDNFSSGNRVAHDQRNKAGDFTTITEEQTWELAGTEEKDVPVAVKAHSSDAKIKHQSPETRTSPTTSYDSPLFGKSGERPSQTSLNKKLFSKASAPESQPQPQRQRKAVPRETSTSSQPTRTARPAARKSAEARSASKTAKSTAPDPSPKPSTKAEAAPKSSETRQTRPRSPVRPQPVTSRLPRRNAPQQSPLNMATIQAKLAASERDADAARVRAKLRAVRKSRDTDSAPTTTTTTTDTPPELDLLPQTHEPEPESLKAPQEDVDPVKKRRDSAPPRRVSFIPSGDGEMDELAQEPLPQGQGGGEVKADDIVVVKRKRDRRTSKVASRRRSTLSPWELEGLISGNVGDVPSPAR